MLIQQAERSEPFWYLDDPSLDFRVYAQPIKLTYFLAGTRFCGDERIALQMWRKGLLGAPLPYLRSGAEVGCGAYASGIDPLAYWAKLRQRRTSPNGVFGITLSTNDIRTAAAQCPALLVELAADRVIQVRRRDRAAQAVARTRAKADTPAIASMAAGTGPHYDFELVAHSYQEILDQEVSWDRIVERTGARSVTIYVEDFEDSVEHTIQELCAFLGIVGVGPDIVDVPLCCEDASTQRDPWIDPFRRDLQFRGLCRREDPVSNSTALKPDAASPAW